jgi:hypothetical protein
LRLQLLQLLCLCCHHLLQCCHLPLLALQLLL